VARQRGCPTADRAAQLRLYSRYPEPGALIFSLDPADIAMASARCSWRFRRWPVGCGAFRVRDDHPGSAEIKRMYVTLMGGARRFGAALLAELERAALEIASNDSCSRSGRVSRRHCIVRASGLRRVRAMGEFVGKDFEHLHGEDSNQG